MLTFVLQLFFNSTPTMYIAIIEEIVVQNVLFGVKIIDLNLVIVEK